MYEYSLGEDKYTFVEDVKHPKSCTILIKGQNDHTIAQLKDAVRDGLRAVFNTLSDGKLVPGAGAFEVAAAHHLQDVVAAKVKGRRGRRCTSCMPSLLCGGLRAGCAVCIGSVWRSPGGTLRVVEGRACAAYANRGACHVPERLCACRAKLGVEVFAQALLALPKCLAENAGFDSQGVLIDLQEQFKAGVIAGIDLSSGEPMDPTVAGVWDNYIVKRQLLQSAPEIASQLLCVDEVLRAGVNMRKKAAGGGM